MALQGPIPVEFGVVFPSGAYAAGAFEPVRNFDASTGEKFVQSADKATGMPMWVIEIIDADPHTRMRAVKVKVAAQVQPVVPAAPAGIAVRPGRVHRADCDLLRQPGRAAGLLAEGNRDPHARPRAADARGEGGGGVKSGGGSFATLYLQVGADWWTLLSTYEDHPPILSSMWVDVGVGLPRRSEGRRLGGRVRPGVGAPGGQVRSRRRAVARKAEHCRRGHGSSRGGKRRGGLMVMSGAAGTGIPAAPGVSPCWRMWRGAESSGARS